MFTAFAVRATRQATALTAFLGGRLRRAACESFEHWADYRAGMISRVALLRRMATRYEVSEVMEV
jgi:hypothetical protein